MPRTSKTTPRGKTGAKAHAGGPTNVLTREAALRRYNEELEQRVRERTEAFHRSEVLKQAIFDSIAAQIVVIDAEGKMLDSNRSWRRLLGTEASASLDTGRTQRHYLAACRRAAAAGDEGAVQILQVIAAVLAGTAETGRVEYRGRPRALRRDRWFALTVTPLGAGAGAVLLHEDISVQHRLEREILEMSERERSQVGQELHDGLCQHLGGVALLAKSLSNVLTNNSRPEAPQAAELAQFIYSAVGETRSVARGLRPVELAEGGLLAALQDLAEQTGARLQCEVRTHGRPRVTSNEIATNLYRIAKEAVANAVKHSGATRVLVRLRQSADRLSLVVEDNGAGFTTPGSDAEGMGLRVMRYRAHSIGARLAIVDRPCAGVTVKCSVPNV